jgi:serine/threonine-protein phosphatase 5
LPLGARVGRTLVCHGGLFRKPPPTRGGGPRLTAAAAAEADEAAEQLPLARLGTLDDLRAAKRGGLDPNGLGAALVASDVLWSDPSAEVRGACMRAEHVPAHTHICLPSS